MAGERRIRITEGDSMEGGVRCPKCGSYTSFGDIIAAGGCARGAWRGGPCDAELALDLIVENDSGRSV
ncbi:hypothetical protein [Halegenticoccus soli]|uniref:hypothetical protein n=1 Tax=Halegenticoccus soli TaxID=1985678 RepID=UPI000C6D13DA|nr:hypothetical protein [Halegenticoccus soli]